MGDEIDRANVIRVEKIGTAWFAFIGPEGLGKFAMGSTPETAVFYLMAACQRDGWPWDEWWIDPAALPPECREARTILESTRDLARGDRIARDDREGRGDQPAGLPGVGPGAV